MTTLKTRISNKYDSVTYSCPLQIAPHHLHLYISSDNLSHFKFKMQLFKLFLVAFAVIVLGNGKWAIKQVIMCIIIKLYTTMFYYSTSTNWLWSRPPLLFARYYARISILGDRTRPRPHTPTLAKNHLGNWWPQFYSERYPKVGKFKSNFYPAIGNISSF